MRDVSEVLKDLAKLRKENGIPYRRDSKKTFKRLWN